MRFEWDHGKNRQNRKKHGLSFEAASLVFADPRAATWIDPVEHDEERWRILGMAAGLALLLVVYTVREEDGDEIIRIISARKATPQERQIYAQTHQKDD